MNDFFDLWYSKKQQKNGHQLLQSKARIASKNLRFVKAKNITEAAHEKHDLFFSQFSCLDCAHCCKGIPPLVNEADAQRIAKFLKIKVTDFKEQYTALDDDGDVVMKHSPCPFLDVHNACSIYSARPRACREYPHTDATDFSKHMELHAINAAYCPAVAFVMEELALQFTRK